MTSRNREDAMMNRQMAESKENLLIDNSSTPDSEMFHYQRQREKEDLVRWQQDLGDDILQFVHDLRREVYDLKTDSWVPVKVLTVDENGKLSYVDAGPLCNDLCIQILVSALRPFMTKNELMSNYSEARILFKLRSTLKTMVRNLCVKHDYYDIDFHDISTIRTIIQNYAMSGPFRAMNNGERRHLETSSRRIETVSQRDPNQKEGWFKEMFHK